MSSIGERIGEVRKDFGLTQKVFGERVGVSPTHISKLEANKDTISSTLIKLISIEYNINELWLRSGTGEKNVRFTETCEKLDQSDSFSDVLSSIKEFQSIPSRAVKVFYSNILTECSSILRNNGLEENNYIQFLQIFYRICYGLSQFKEHLKPLLKEDYDNESENRDAELLVENFKNILIKDINMLVELYKSEPLVPKEFKKLDNC